MPDFEKMAMEANSHGNLECGVKAPEGWLGQLDLEFDIRAGRIVPARKRQIGPLKVQQVFYPEGSACHL